MILSLNFRVTLGKLLNLSNSVSSWTLTTYSPKSTGEVSILQVDEMKTSKCKTGLYNDR
jgi:hypothetical protein